MPDVVKPLHEEHVLSPDAAAGPYMPSTHTQALTLLDPTLPVVMWGGHEVQLLLLAAPAKDPTGHRLHAVLPRSEAVCPNGHSTQALAPRESM
mmetsp:Transcript_37668/g.113809  ORF Transcript_37668/g.113809 Transcript_37668/m.113809 type:complete len:93 (-) Transcript_37668:138-416(-)